MNSFEMSQAVIVADKPAIFGGYGPQAGECSVVFAGADRYTIVKTADVKPAPTPKAE